MNIEGVTFGPLNNATPDQIPGSNPPEPNGVDVFDIKRDDKILKRIVLDENHPERGAHIPLEFSGTGWGRELNKDPHIEFLRIYRELAAAGAI